MNPELISVVVPVYNPDESFYKTIQSVLNQTYKYFELILVDDGSEIDIANIVNPFNDLRIRYYKQEHQNANVARNYGITQSQGEYIAMLDSDDIWLETHLEDCINTLQNNDADGLYGSLILKHADGREQSFHVRRLNEDENMINYLLQTGYGAQTSTLFLTSESVKDILWNPSLKRHQDYDFVVRYSRKYRLIPKENPSVIYVYSSKEKMIDFNSCIQFIKSNIDDIEPQLYNNYNFNMFLLAKNKSATDDIIKHYIKEATRYKVYLSYHKYIMIRHPKNWFEKIKCKLEYLFHVLQVRVE
jgi:glycosyltransferase involved in cell wall biosynthesis